MAFALSGYKVGSYNGDWPNWLQDQYFDRVFYAIQQQDQKLAGIIPTTSFDPGAKQMWFRFAKKLDGTSGKADTIASGMVTGIANAVGADIRQVTARYQETQNEYHETYKRRCTTQRWRHVPMIERVDTMGALTNPNDPITVNTVARFNRKKDEILIAALGAEVYEGYDAVSTGAWTESVVSFNSSHIIDSDGSDVLTFDKIEEGYEKFRTLDVDFQGETPVLLCGPRQIRNLREEEKLINFDYSANRPLDQRDFVRLPDGTIVLWSNLLSATDNIRTCYLFLPSGMIHAIEEEMYTSMSKREDRNEATQIFFEHCSGATRLQDEKVLKILCNEA